MSKKGKKTQMKQLIIAIVMALASTLPANSKKLPSYLKGIVFFESSRKDPKHPDLPPKTIGVGFVTEFKDKLMIVSNLKTFVFDYPPKIRTIDGETVPFSNAYVASDKRNLIFFEVKNDFPKEKVKIIPLDTDVSGNINIDEKVIVYSRKPKSKTIKYKRGKLTGLGAQDIDVYLSTKYDVTGGPVIYYDTGKCIGCITTHTGDLKGKVFKANRIDTVKNLTVINKDWATEDIAKVHKKFLILKQMKAIATKYQNYKEKMLEEIKKSNGTKSAKIVSIKRKATITFLKGELKKLAEPADFHFSFYNSYIEGLADEGKAILDEIMEISTDDVKEARKNARKHNYEDTPFKE